MNSLFTTIENEKTADLREICALDTISKSWNGNFTTRELMAYIDYPFVYFDFLGYNIPESLHRFLFDNARSIIGTKHPSVSKPIIKYLEDRVLDRRVENCFTAGNDFIIELLVTKSTLKKNSIAQSEMSDSAIDFFVYNLKTYEQKYFSIKLEDINKIGTIIQNSFPGFNSDNDPEVFTSCIKNVRKKYDNLHTLYVCRSSGWHKILGKNFFVLDNMCAPYPFLSYESGVSICYTEAFSLAEVWDKLLSISKCSLISYQLILIQIIAILFKPFEESGHQIQYVNFISGSSGSKKTSTAKALFGFMASSTGLNVLSFADDTMAAIERAIVLEGGDNITIVDDVAPQPSLSRANTQKNQLEMIIRMAGNGQSRSRSNSSLGISHGEGVHGEIVITGELSSLSNSSSLRCNHIRFAKDDIDNNTLTWFQNNPDAIGFFYMCFIRFVEDQYISIVNHIKSTYDNLLKDARHSFSEPRIAQLYTIQYIAYSIFLEFLRISNTINNPYEIRVIIEKSLRDNALFNINFSQQTSLTKRFCKAIESAKETNKLTICCDKTTFKSNPSADGFMSNGSIYIRKEALFKAFVEYDRYYSGDTNWNVDSLVRTLADEALIIKHRNGDRDTYEKRIDFGEGRKVPFIDISIEKYNEVLND